MIHFQVMARALAILLHLLPVSRARVEQPGWAETPDQRIVRYYAIASDVSVVAIELCKENRACAMSAVTSALGVAWHESGFAPDVDAGKCYRGKDGKNERCDGGNAHSMWQLHVGSAKASVLKPLAVGTLEMSAWAKEVLHDQSLPLGSKVDKVFGTRRIRAYVETHPADASIPHPHRGVSLHESLDVDPREEGKLYDTDRRAAAREAMKRIGRSRRECARPRGGFPGAPPEEQLAIYAGGACKLPGAVVKSRELYEYIKKAASAPDLPKPSDPPATPAIERVVPSEVASK